jgi:formylglycine-generating enzyme required for sulfatase activity
VEDYRGEAPVDWGGAIAAPIPASNEPRLIADGADRTPPSAPERLVTIDRLVHLSLAKDRLQYANIFLAGSCVGTQAHFGDDPTRPSLSSATTCVDQEKQRVPVTDVPLSDTSAEHLPSKVGTWLFEPCPAPSSTSTRVCIAGGATLIGSDDEELNQYQRTVPSRVFALHRFFIDRDEVTVGTYRDALRHGLVTENPTTNNGPLGPPSYCTGSKDPMGREDFPLNCITRTAALDYCHFQGGDLPTEVQWEHVATLAGRTAKAPYPWGNEESFGCTDLVYARYAGATCASAGLGPASTSEPSALDVTPLGVRRLGGSLSEWVKDDAADYRDACWGNAPLVDPSCQKSGALLSARGMGWEFPVAHSVVRFDAMPGQRPEAFGFRCVYAEDAP